MSKIQASTTSDFGVIGTLDGVKIIEAIRNGEAVMREVLVERAAELHGNDQAKADWLAGFQKALIDNGQPKGQAQVRSSEARKVFQAMHIACTTSSGTDEAQAQMLGVQKLTNISGGYAQLIDGCRAIVAEAMGETNRTGSSKGKVKKLNAKDVESIGKRLIESGASVALEVLDKAQTAFIRNAGTPDGIVRQAMVYAVELSKSQDNYYSTLGKDLEQRLTQALLHSSEQKQAAIKAEQERLDREKLANAKDAQPQAVAPTPAQPGNVVQQLEELENADASELDALADLDETEEPQQSVG